MREGRMREGRMREGRMREGRMREGRMREGRMREGRMQNERRQNERRQNERRQNERRQNAETAAPAGRALHIEPRLSALRRRIAPSIRRAIQSTGNKLCSLLLPSGKSGLSLREVLLFASLRRGPHGSRTGTSLRQAVGTARACRRASSAASPLRSRRAKRSTSRPCNSNGSS